MDVRCGSWLANYLLLTTDFLEFFAILALVAGCLLFVVSIILTWLDLFLIGWARPKAAGLKRLSTEPPSTLISFIVSLSSDRLCVLALAIADLISFMIGLVAFLSAKAKELRAEVTLFPRTRSATKRTFLGEWRRLFICAVIWAMSFIFAEAQWWP